MEIIRSKHMGLCFGVSAAIKICYEIMHDMADQHKKIYILGMLVHNEYVVNDLISKGFIIIEEKDLLKNNDLLQKGDILIIRAHGTTKKIYDILEKKGIEYYDATCTFVSRIKDTLIKKEKEGYEIIFLGDKDHPEVKGIISFGKNINVVSNKEELEKFYIDPNKKYTVLTQTTLNKKKFEESEKYLKNNFQNVTISDKICGATQVRQSAAEELAKEVELMLVVGGKNSSNTHKLFNISQSINKNTYLIQDENDLQAIWFKGVNKVGITSGASTPDEIINKIEKKLKEGFSMQNQEKENEFITLLDDYLPTEENSKIKVTGSIVQKDRNYVYLDVPGQRTSVRVKADEMEGLEKGDEAEVILIGETEEGDFIIGSRKRVLMEEGNQKIDEAVENKQPIKVKITKKVKGGYIAEYNGIQGFIPNSLSEIPQNSTENVEGMEMNVIVKEVKIQKGVRGRKITFSKKDVTMIEADKEFSQLKIDDIVDCEIINVLDFGLSVKFQNLRGFIHISEVSWKKMDKLTDIYKIGDKIQAKIISLEPEKRNVKLSIKRLTKNPWETAAETFKIDDVVDGIVTRITQYGIFVQIADGVEGLVHMNDFSWNRKRMNLEEYVKENDKVKVKIIDFTPDERKLKLGIKQLSEDPWNTAESKYAVGTVVKGKVAEVKSFGIFVEIEPGIDAFIHQSDFTWKGEPQKQFAKGDEVEFKIIELNTESNKIKGSIKLLTKSPWEKAMEVIKVGQVVEKEIKTVADFGLFINLIDGIDGFIPTQLASDEHINNIKDKFTEGQVIKAQIIEIDNEKQRIKLSIKKLEADEKKRENKELLEKYGTSGEIDKEVK